MNFHAKFHFSETSKGLERLKAERKNIYECINVENGEIFYERFCTRLDMNAV